MTMDLFFERNPAYFSGFSSGENIHLIQNRPVQRIKDTYISWKKIIYV
jgi:hypothetical protein